LARFVCHCRICQSVYRAPFADVTVWRADDVVVTTGAPLCFRRHRLPPALDRGVCAACADPVVGYLRVAPFVRLAFVPARSFASTSRLPRRSIHIFYDRRVRDVRDDLPKISGYWASELAVARLVLAGMLGTSSAS
jgi:hypothetical protein